MNITTQLWTWPAFRYLHETFPRLSKAESKERVLADPQFRELFKDDLSNNLHVQHIYMKRNKRGMFLA